MTKRVFTYPPEIQAIRELVQTELDKASTTRVRLGLILDSVDGRALTNPVGVEVIGAIHLQYAQAKEKSEALVKVKRLLKSLHYPIGTGS